MTLLLLTLITLPLDYQYIIIPIFTSGFLFIYFFISLWKKDKRIPIIDIGLFCMIFTTMYTIIPLLNFLFGGFNFGDLADGRLQHLKPTSSEVGLFFSNHILYIIGFLFLYIFFRKPNNIILFKHVTPPSKSLTYTIFFSFFLISTYFFILKFGFSIGIQSHYHGDDNLTKGPLVLEQINGKLSDISFMFYHSIIAFLILSKNKKLDLVLGLLISYEFISLIIFPGSRGELIMLILITLIYAYVFRKIKISVLVGGLFIGFFLFSFFGVYRAGSDLSQYESFFEWFKVIASASNEFQALFATSFEVNFFKDLREIPLILYFNDFVPILPPQQFLPFEKIAGAYWYLEQRNAASGEGYMWSVISQSLIGFGKVELIIRGIILGLLLSYIHRWYLKRSYKFLPTIIYVHLSIATVWTFRDTTGAILWTIYWTFIPFCLFFYFLGFRNLLKKQTIT